MRFAAFKSGVLAVALTGAAVAQTTIRATTTLVVVPTMVENAGKETVFSLKSEDFVLTDNGVPQKVMLEDGTNRPLSLVVLMQTGGAARGQFEGYTNLETMLTSILGGAPNKAAIVNFDSRVEAASPFTSDISEWRDAIDHPDRGDSGAAIFDGISYGLDLLKKEPEGNRRAILLISQERDNGSKTTLKEVVARIGETNTAIYSVTFSAQKTEARQAFKDCTHLNPPIVVGSPIEVNSAARPIQGYFDLGAPLKLIFGAMQKNLSAEVAGLSGGEANGFDNRNELEEALGRVNSHIRNSYILSFQPVSADPGLHSIKVQVARHPEVMVFARSGYWVADTAR